MVETVILERTFIREAANGRLRALFHECCSPYEWLLRLTKTVGSISQKIEEKRRCQNWHRRFLLAWPRLFRNDLGAHKCVGQDRRNPRHIGHQNQEDKEHCKKW